jgi:transcriptional regulator with XRE-family HTH domain
VFINNLLVVFFNRSMYSAIMWIPERARKRLVFIGRTRKWLAEYCGIERTSLNENLRDNGRPPSRPVLKLMAQALECDECYLDPPIESERESRTQAVG